MSIYGDTQENAEIKIIVLYFVHRLRLSPTAALLTRVMLENRFLNYFQLHQCLHDLAAEGFLSVLSEDGVDRYEITETGRRILNMFAGIMPAGVRVRLDENIDAIRMEYRADRSVRADHVLVNEDEYSVRLRILEDEQPLVDLRLSVGSREDARTMCRNWKANASAMYPRILSLLLSDAPEATTDGRAEDRPSDQADDHSGDR